jgi:hypothetical protein
MEPMIGEKLCTTKRESEWEEKSEECGQGCSMVYIISDMIHTFMRSEKIGG